MAVEINKNVFLKDASQLAEFILDRVQKSTNSTNFKNIQNNLKTTEESAENLRDIIFVTGTESQALALRNALEALMGNSLNFDFVPSYCHSGVFRFESVKQTLASRVGSAWKLANLDLSKNMPFACFSVASFCRTIPTNSWLQKHAIEIVANSECDQDKLLEKLLPMHYSKTDCVEHVGEFSIRGSIVDIWPPGEKNPVRIEFFGDEVTAIRKFRVHDQKSFEKVSAIVLLPMREFVWGDVEANVFEDFNKTLLSQGIRGTTRSDYLEQVREHIPFPGIDDTHMLFSKTEYTTWESFLSKRIVEVVFFGGAKEHALEIEKLKKTYTIPTGFSVSQNILRNTLENLYPNIEKYSELFLKLSAGSEIKNSASAFLENFWKEGKLSSKITVLSKWLMKSPTSKLIFTFESLETFLELKSAFQFTLKETEFAKDLESSELKLSQSIFSLNSLVTLEKNSTSILFVLAPKLSDVFVCSNSLIVSEAALRGHKGISSENFAEGETVEGAQKSARSHEIAAQQRIKLQFGVASETSNKEKSREAAKMLMSAQFGEFNEGDFVVHIQHGVAKFLGLASLEIMDVRGDFLILEYADKDKIYVPVDKMNLVQRFVGNSGDDSVLDSLRTKTWEKKRTKAKVDAEKIAKELLEHEARRATSTGTAFSACGDDFFGFESAFPYDETEDQLRAIADIMKDMSSPLPMDRLLVGDVGFGKTEVAMRAAFRCVLEGKQTAWLVPTTVLAHQHFRSLKERFADFGVRIEACDRNFGKRTLESVKKGEVDILVGTHRILSPDVQFRDLGLLVVDEEQRFGVLQKEKIKKLAYGIDVLTMSATPIPRTLHLAMIGLKDLSLLTTPPKSRLAVKTFVAPFEEKTVQDALEAELARGGQVFYVHNRVQELPAVEEYLKKLIPQARICVGHGQMGQNELEKVVIEFLDGKFDIMLCTTIIESGIDMPNVNTILIQNAEQFGLAQLYQLRGRVGRRSSRGYAYFLTSRKLDDEEDGFRRLEILRENQELGSGFVIASHDLEMRGAGDVLSSEQSGKSNDIGFEAFNQMLDEAIANLGKVKIQVREDAEIHIPLQTQIPMDYIENDKERLRAYRRFFASQTESDISGLLAECEDRFGPAPELLRNLADVARVKRALMNVHGVSLVVKDDCTEIKISREVMQADSSDIAAQNFIAKLLDVCNRSPSSAVKAVAPKIVKSFGVVASKNQAPAIVTKAMKEESSLSKSQASLILPIKEPLTVRLTPDGRIVLGIRKRQFFAPYDSRQTMAELLEFLFRLGGEGHDTISTARKR